MYDVYAKPSLKGYLELPIQVSNTWDAYPVIATALAQLSQGQFLNASLLCDALATDDRISACLATRINGLFGLPMEFKWQGQEEHQGDVADAGGDKVVQLKQAIARKAERKWEQMFPASALKELVRWGLLINAGVGELVWRWDDDGELLPVLKSWNSQFLYWRWDTRSYWLIHQGGQTELRPGNGTWTLFAPTGHNHGWLYGLIRALGMLYLDRRFAFRDWSRASEKYALGIIKGYMPADASLADKLAFTQALRNPPSEVSITLPMLKDGKKGFDVEMLETDQQTSADTFQKRIQQLDTSIAVAILGQNLSTEVNHGSRAAAQVHENVRGDYLKADNEILASTVKTQVLGPWVKANWAADAAELGVPWTELVPNVSWKVDPPEDKKEAAAAIASIGTALPGFAGTPIDVRALLEQNGIPVIDKDALPDRPPPGDVNERPRAEDPPSNDLPGPGELHEDDEQYQASRKAKATQRSKGAHQGQPAAEELAAHYAQHGAREMARRRKELMEIVKTSRTFEEVRTRVKALYYDFGPSPLREVMEAALVKAELLGRLSSHEDRA